MPRIFITSKDKRYEAREIASDYAAQLRAQNLTPTHRIAVERKARTWCVVLVIDEPEDESEES